jgi:TolB protein
MNNKKFGLMSVLNVLIITALVLAGCAQATPTEVPALPTATSITLPSPTAAPALPTATALTIPSPTKAPTTIATTAKSTVQGQIVFQVDPGNNRTQIYIERADGSGLRQLVKSDFYDNTPSLSPDGRTIVFTRETPDGAPIYQSWTFVVNVDGTHLHELNTGSCNMPCGTHVEGHAWSPNGKQIAYVRGEPNADGSCCLVIGWWVMQADGSGAHLLWNLTDAEEDHISGWSPDGKRFVFMRRDNTTSPVRYAIFTKAIDGSDLQQVTPWELHANQPAWSPDGKLIAFCAPSCDWFDGETNIYTIHPDGTGLTQLTSHLRTTDNGSMVTDSPSWSPDGSQIVFAHGPSPNDGNDFFDLYEMNRDGSGLHVVLPNIVLSEDYPDWGPSPAP